MRISEAEDLIKKMELEKLQNIDNQIYVDILNQQITHLKDHVFKNLTPWDRVYLARHPNRPKAKDYIKALIDDFYELHGDRLYGDDQAIIGGIGWFEGYPITVLSQSKGKSVDENIKMNFGMPHPEGYRKICRLAKQAEKFHRPILNIIDTPGAYPGKEAEQRGQSLAIAESLRLFSTLTVPVISVVIGEGGSGGALALGVADRVVMLENAIYSVLSPEGFASILWKDDRRKEEASALMKLTAESLAELKVIDKIIKESKGGAQHDFPQVIQELNEYLKREFAHLKQLKSSDLVKKRYQKYRQIGVID